MGKKQLQALWWDKAARRQRLEATVCYEITLNNLQDAQGASTEKEKKSNMKERVRARTCYNSQTRRTVESFRHAATNYITTVYCDRDKSQHVMQHSSGDWNTGDSKGTALWLCFSKPRWTFPPFTRSSRLAHAAPQWTAIGTQCGDLTCVH